MQWVETLKGLCLPSKMDTKLALAIQGSKGFLDQSNIEDQHFEKLLENESMLLEDISFSLGEIENAISFMGL